MNCRVCNQSISFVKGRRAPNVKRATYAVHDSEVSQAMNHINGETVTPHPGSQRKLRQALEDAHQQNQQPAWQQGARQSERQTQPSGQPARQDFRPAGDYGSRQEAQNNNPGSNAPEAEVPGAQAVNQPAQPQHRVQGGSGD